MDYASIYMLHTATYEGEENDPLNGIELTEGVNFDLGVVMKLPLFSCCEDIGLLIVDDL